MKKRDSNKDMIFLLVISILTVIIWVGFDVYRAFTKTEPVVEADQFLEPLNPTLNLTVFTELNSRIE